MAVKNGYFALRIRKTRFKPFDGLRRKRNLRNEDQCSMPIVHNVPNCLQINFGFPTARHPEKQERPCRSLNCLFDRVDRMALFGIQDQLGGWPKDLVGKWVARHLCCFDYEPAFTL